MFGYVQTIHFLLDLILYENSILPIKDLIVFLVAPKDWAFLIMSGKKYAHSYMLSIRLTYKPFQKKMGNNIHLFYRENSISDTSSPVAPQENVLGSFFYSRNYVHIHIIFHILLRA